eukprot:SAG31_NODE_762_length_12275_cov_14.077119_2_plen_102_part_00
MPEDAQRQMQQFLSCSILHPADRERLLPTLVGKVKDIPKFEVVITHLLNFAVAQYEQQKYILPREKWSLLRSICICLLVLGWYDNSTYLEKDAKKIFSRQL